MIDEHARLAIRSRLTETLHVNAGAGSGKTTELVHRVLALVESGVPLRNLAVITFTVAAAGELRDRVREGLEARALHEALAELDDATITTLHGFAQRILADHPLEAGLPPAFEVLDEIEESIEFEVWWGDTLDTLFGDAPDSAVLRERAVAVLLAAGVPPSQLRDVASILFAHHDRLEPAPDPPTVVPALDVAAILAPLDRAMAWRAGCRDARDKLFEHLDGLERIAAVLRDGDERDALQALAGCGKFTTKVGRKGAWGRDGKAAVLAELAAVDKAAATALDATVGAATGVVLGFLVERVRTRVAARAAEGRLTYHDLLVRARDVVRDDVTVRRALHRRYHVVLLDESQDTDPLQIDIAARIAAADPAAAGGDWHDVAVGDGRLFVVGDPKQAIYRFRRADLSVYLGIRRALGGEELELRTNFRSRPGILAWVNHCFAPILRADADGLQVEFLGLDAARPADPEAGVPVVLVGGPLDSGTAMRELRRVEASDLAAAAARVVTEGWRVRARPGEPGAIPLDPGDLEGEWVRPARCADIAMLLPTRASLSYLEEAFEEAGIPLRIESQSLVYATDDVRELLEILTAIDDPTDEVAIVASLRTPAFGCSDRHLLEWIEAGGRWSYSGDRWRPDGVDPGAPVAAGLAALRDLHERHQWQSVSETVAEVVRERRLLELALARPRPRDHWRRIRFLVDRARAFADRSDTRLRSFIAWVRRQATEGSRVNETVVPEPDDDAVRVLTVHGSKGLEFPVVLLAGLSVKPTAHSRRCFHTDAGPEVRFKGGERHHATAGFEDAYDFETRAEAAELHRLLYVAATRARDHLVVAVHHTVAKGGGGKVSLAQLLHGHSADAPSQWRQLDDAAPLPLPAESSFEGHDGDPIAARDAWRTANEAAIAILAATGAVAATALAHADDIEPPPDAPPWRRGRAGTAIGRAVHAVLQSVDLDSGAGIAGAARAQALAEGITGRAVEVRALAESALAAPSVRAAVASGRYWREVPVAARVGHLMVEGFVDLLVELDGGLVVVDYKTDQVSEAEAGALMERYRIQGAAYALALATVLGRPVERCVFVFARPGGAFEREVDDLPAAVADVHSLIEARAPVGAAGLEPATSAL